MTRPLNSQDKHINILSLNVFQKKTKISLLSPLFDLFRLSICLKEKFTFNHQSLYNFIVRKQITPSANANINSLTMTDQIVELKENKRQTRGIFIHRDWFVITILQRTASKIQWKYVSAGVITITLQNVHFNKIMHLI